MPRKRKTTKQKRKIPPEILSLAKELVRLKKQAEALGVFTNDRELLECKGCGLAEDITFEGMLITYYRGDAEFKDTGLRFEKVKDTIFRCPVCRARLKATWL